ncbi:MAG: NAD(P)H-dependent oxidoreductase [Pseudomonadota bacterium]
MTRILRIDASMRHDGSVTRGLADQVEARILARDPGAEITRRDLSDPLPQIDEAWIGANFTDPDARSAEQREVLGLSDSLIAEIRAADVLLLAVPMYNFGVPAAMKLWIDQITRARETFRYTETGPVGLITGKRAILVTGSGGTAVDGPMDFTTPYLRHILGFLGITDVSVVAAERQMADGDAVEKAEAAIAGLAA